MRTARQRRTQSAVIAVLMGAMLLLYGVGSARAQALPGGQTTNAAMAPVVGEIQSITINDPNDVYSGGTMVIGGNTVVIPANMVLELPANRLTLWQMFDQAPPACKALGETGLAASDTCLTLSCATGAPSLRGAIATVEANRANQCGSVIAGFAMLEKGQETVTGVVTHIDYTDGFFKVNGVMGDPATGAMVRFNDPEGIHTIQQGLGCDAANGPNCSADPRYTNDPENYTFHFSTGYPVCIPSTTVGNLASTGLDESGRSAGSSASGVGDAFCPDSNRDTAPAADSTLFAPIRVGDPVTAEGNYEVINGVLFLSAHSIAVGVALTTKNDANSPDYLIFEEVEWDAPGFNNERVRLLLIGFTSLGTSQLDVYSLHIDPTGVAHEVPLASTVGNPDTINQGIGGGAAGIFRVRYDVDFFVGAPVKSKWSACENLSRAGFVKNPGDAGYCVNNPGMVPFGTIEEEFSILSPITRDLIARSRHKLTLNPGVVTRNIRGQVATNGEYLNPVGVGHPAPEMVEINIGLLATPFIFSGEPWNLDRRLGPGGCVLGCPPGPPIPLDPFPYSGLDPRTQAGNPGPPPSPGVPVAVRDRIFAIYPFGPTDTLLPVWPPADGCNTAPPVTNSAPVAGDDFAFAIDTAPVTLTPLANDSDPDGDAISILSVDAVSANGGTIVDLGGDSYRYTAPAGFSGPDSFTYDITDGSLVATGLVSIEVLQPDHLRLDKAIFRVSRSKWRVTGAATILGAPLGPGNTVTLYLGPTVGGPVIGTAEVDLFGIWKFNEANTPVPPGPETTISIQSSAGDLIEGIDIKFR